MNIKIYYLDKTIILAEKNEKLFLKPDIHTIDITNSSHYLTVHQILLNWLLRADEKFLSLRFHSTELLVAFISMFLPNYFKVMYAAGGLIENSDNEFLFIYKRGYWDLPKGKIDKNEKIEDAAIRECMEETGISDLKINENLALTFHIFQQKEEWILKITQWFLMHTDYKKPLLPQAEEGIEKAEWLNITSIKNKVLANTYPSITELLYRKGILKQEI